MDPQHYGRPLDRHTKISDNGKRRDVFEIMLTRMALQAGLPLLSICRGMQILNVALGGTLHQHLEGHRSEDNDVVTTHPVHVDRGTQLARILGSAQIVQANSHHHQAVNRLGHGLVATARAADGTIEALESRQHAWVVAVQWHPERVNEVPPQMLQLFKGFVSVANEGKRPR